MQSASGSRVYFFTRASKNAHTVLTLTAVLIQTCERQSYAFRNESTKENEEDCNETVEIEGHQQYSLHLRLLRSLGAERLRQGDCHEAKCTMLPFFGN